MPAMAGPGQAAQRATVKSPLRENGLYLGLQEVPSPGNIQGKWPEMNEATVSEI